MVSPRPSLPQGDVPTTVKCRGWPVRNHVQQPLKILAFQTPQCFIQKREEVHPYYDSQNHDPFPCILPNNESAQGPLGYETDRILLGQLALLPYCLGRSQTETSCNRIGLLYSKLSRLQITHPGVNKEKKVGNLDFDKHDHCTSINISTRYCS